MEEFVSHPNRERREERGGRKTIIIKECEIERGWKNVALIF